jgi:hypothetical protein
MKKIFIMLGFVLIAVTDTFADRCSTAEEYNDAFTKYSGGSVSASGEYTPPLMRDVKKADGTVTPFVLSNGEAKMLELHYREGKETMGRLGSMYFNDDTVFIAEDGRTINTGIIRYDLVPLDRRDFMRPFIEKYTADFQAKHGGTIVNSGTYVLPEYNLRGNNLRNKYFNGMYELIRTDLPAGHT